MQKQTIRGLLITGAIALVLSGCGHKPASSTAASQASAPPAAGSQTTPPPQETAAVKDSIRLPIKAYYGDEQATKLVEQEVAISYKEAKDKYTTALGALKQAPANSKLVPLAAALSFKSAVLKDKLLTVDLTVAAEGRLGAPGEAMLLDAIQKTLLQFPEVDAIELLVDGKPAESLMGHMELPHPMKRN